MTTKKKVQILFDSAMTIILPMLMAYSLVGELAHEWLGISMFVLFLAHHAINWGWHLALFKGSYTLRRTANIAINVLLFFDMIVQMVSGMILSRHVFVGLPLQEGMAFARTWHLLGSFWGFILMSVHLGFHVNAVISSIGNGSVNRRTSALRRTIVRTVVIAISAYGAYAFVKREIAMYLFLIIRFVFIDYSKPVALFYADYVSIMVLFAFVGHILSGMFVKFTKNRR